jgi:hypothetical protein
MALGLTNPYKVQDGIDQGDTISPLLWRIFYDPLLQEVEDKCKGYQMKTTWIDNLTNSRIKRKKHVI